MLPGEAGADVVEFAPVASGDEAGGVASVFSLV